MSDTKVFNEMIFGSVLVVVLWIGSITLFASVWVGFWTGLLIGAVAYISGLLVNAAYSYVVHKRLA